MKERFHFAILLAAAYLPFRDVISIALTSKELTFILGGIYETSINCCRYSLPLIMPRLNLIMNNLTKLTLHGVNDFNCIGVQLSSFAKVTALKLDIVRGVEAIPIQTNGTNTTIGSFSKLQSLELSRFILSTNQLCQLISASVNLKRLKIEYGTPISLDKLVASLQPLKCLEDISLVSCLTDRSTLVLNGFPELSKLRVEKCMNVVGVSALHTPKLTYCSFMSIPITAHTLESFVSGNPQLRSLIVSNCLHCLGALSITHRHLRHLSLEGCSRLRFVRLQCGSLEYLDVQKCHEISHLYLRSSDTLSQLNLRQLACLRVLDVHCAGLRALHLTGCTHFEAAVPIDRLRLTKSGGVASGDSVLREADLLSVGKLALGDVRRAPVAVAGSRSGGSKVSAAPVLVAGGSSGLGRRDDLSDDVDATDVTSDTGVDSEDVAVGKEEEEEGSSDDSSSNDSNNDSSNSVSNRVIHDRLRRNHKRNASNTTSISNSDSSVLLKVVNQTGSTWSYSDDPSCHWSVQEQFTCFFEDLAARSPNFSLKRFVLCDIHGSKLHEHIEELLACVDVVQPHVEGGELPPRIQQPNESPRRNYQRYTKLRTDKPKKSRRRKSS
jgi:hypothetical protein